METQLPLAPSIAEQKNAKVKYNITAPTHVEIIGSISQQTALLTFATPVVDVAVFMPKVSSGMLSSIINKSVRIM